MWMVQLEDAGAVVIFVDLQLIAPSAVFFPPLHLHCTDSVSLSVRVSMALSISSLKSEMVTAYVSGSRTW